MAEYLPKFHEKLPRTLLVNVGGRLKLQTRVDGNPKPEVFWFKDNCLVLQDNSHKYENDDENDEIHVLKIDPVLLNDEGEYEFRVENCMGQVSCFCQVETRILLGLFTMHSSGSIEKEEICEERQSGIFILFDEGSHDEDDDEVNDEDDENEQDNQQAFHRSSSLSASEQIQDIIENLSKRKDKMSHSDLKDAGSKSATISPCQSPIPLQRMASTTSSIDLDASLRITEVTSPTEMYSDHQPLIREDSVDSRDEKETNISCGLEITELEDDTIMEEDEEDEELMEIEIAQNSEMLGKIIEEKSEVSSVIGGEDGLFSRTSNICDSGNETPVFSVGDDEKSLKKSVDSGFGKITPEKIDLKDKKSDLDEKYSETMNSKEKKKDFDAKYDEKMNFKEITSDFLRNTKKKRISRIKNIILMNRENYESSKESDPRWNKLLNTSSNAIEEVEDIFERSKRELDEILDIAKSSHASRKTLRIDSDDDLDEEIERIRREFAGKRKFDALGKQQGSKIDLFDIKKSKKVEDIFEKSRKEMKEYLQDVKKSRDELFGADFKEDDWFFKSDVLRPVEEGVSGSFQTDKSLRDMRKRWKNEVGKSEKEISSEMGLTWPPVHGLWIESSEGSDTSGSFGLSERERRGRCVEVERAEAEVKDMSEQADDDTSKLDDDSIIDELTDGFEEKEIVNKNSFHIHYGEKDFHRRLKVGQGPRKCLNSLLGRERDWG
uniref:Ig-like domain-containing protein n=1 Tax=Strigamia maritima TaxID=126957 RepID=T1IIA4_STRMM